MDTLSRHIRRTRVWCVVACFLWQKLFHRNVASRCLDRRPPRSDGIVPPQASGSSRQLSSSTSVGAPRPRTNEPFPPRFPPGVGSQVRASKHQHTHSKDAQLPAVASPDTNTYTVLAHSSQLDCSKSECSPPKIWRRMEGAHPMVCGRLNPYAVASCTLRRQTCRTAHSHPTRHGTIASQNELTRCPQKASSVTAAWGLLPARGTMAPGRWQKAAPEVYRRP